MKTSAKVGAGGGLVLASAMLIAFLGKWEGGAEYTVYADQLAGGLPTACKGLTKHVTRTPIIVGEVWTPEKCEREERAALIKVQTQLRKCFATEPQQSVFDSASSHAWNFGVAATCGSAAMRAWNDGKVDLGCRRIAHSDSGKPVWSYVKSDRLLENGKPEMVFVRGLARRRTDEVELCLGRW